MKDSMDLDFLYEVANKISARSRESAPISTDEVFDLFKDTFESMTEVRTIEVPLFMPFIIEREDDLYIARCRVYSICRGIGRTEEEAIQKLKEEIELYNKSSIETEKKMRIEEMVRNIFPKDRF